jgi:type I site-specific restriction-modification system R (restriction) subunit
VLEGPVREASAPRPDPRLHRFEDDGSGALVKKMAGYHQFHAVQVAVTETLRAAGLRREADRVAEVTGSYEAGGRPGGKPGDRRIGVVWHTQGSGKSLTMAFYAGRIIREPVMENPTLVVLTDRNDLGDQLFSTFSRCSELLRQPPVPAESRAHLRELLRVEAGGVVFTTIQKFEETTEGEEADRKEKLKTKWAQLEAIVGAEKRLKLVARDIVQHFERRLEAMDGKAMVCARAGASAWSCTAS